MDPDMKSALALLGFCFFLLGCHQDTPSSFRTLEEFSKLDSASSLDDVRRRFGPPDRDDGSGLYIYVYRLQDGSEVAIGASNPSRLLYVCHGTNELFKSSVR